MIIHHLKTVNPHFQDVWDGKKTFEIRRNDRNFQIGDHLVLVEYFPETPNEVGRAAQGQVTHLLNHEDFPEGLQPEYCCMAVDVYELYEVYD